MGIEEYFGKWLKFIDQRELEKVVGELNRLPKEVLCPEYKNVFRAFNLCPCDRTKVVMIGQDPYPQKGVATGILFGNRAEVEEDKLSPSLQIIKEAAINFEVPHNSIIFDQTLESWAQQGVLMLNSALTVELGKPGSHTMMWRPFLSSFIRKFSKENHGLVYMLFGEQAKTFRPYIDKYNYVFEEKHPAYYARIGKKMPSGIFREVEGITESYHKDRVVWFEERWETGK